MFQPQLCHQADHQYVSSDENYTKSNCTKYKKFFKLSETSIEVVSKFRI